MHGVRRKELQSGEEGPLTMACTGVTGLARAAALVLLLSAPAAAQMPLPLNMPLGGNKPPPTPEEVERQKALDNAYKSATQKIPDKRVNDPWSTVRPEQKQATSAAPAAKKKPPQQKAAQ